jgi:hypothetical protein
MNLTRLLLLALVCTVLSGATATVSGQAEGSGRISRKLDRFQLLLDPGGVVRGEVSGLSAVIALRGSGSSFHSTCQGG